MDADQQRRQAERDRITGVAVDVIHTESCRVVPTRNHLLDALPKGGVVAEVGVAAGDFSRELLARVTPAKLHLIDAWQDARFSDGYAAVEKQFGAEIHAGSVILHRGLSVETLSAFPSEYFDFIYIDTTHAYDLTLLELNAAVLKVKPNGLIGGHDFCAGNVVAPHVYGVVQAVSKFCLEHRWRYKYISIDPDTYFSFCLDRIPDETRPHLFVETVGAI